MASLTLTIGQLTATVNASDAKAAALVTQYAAAIGATGTQQQRANAVVQALVRHMQQQAQQQRVNVAQAQALVDAQPDLDGLTWDNG